MLSISSEILTRRSLTLAQYILFSSTLFMFVEWGVGELPEKYNTYTYFTIIIMNKKYVFMFITYKNTIFTP